MKKIQARKWQTGEKLEWRLLKTMEREELKRGVPYAITVVSEVGTMDGKMLMVTMQSAFDVSDPSLELAVKFGELLVEKNGKRIPQAPSLFYWRDAVWTVASDSAFMGPYYNNKQHVLYQVALDGFGESWFEGFDLKLGL